MGQLFGKASLEDLIYSTLLNYFLYFLKLLFKPKLAQSFNLNRNIYLVRIKMREKRTISVRHPQLVRFRNALREVLSTAKSIEYRRLLDEGRGLRPTVSEGDAEKRGELSDKQHRLETAWNKSLCPFGNFVQTAATEGRLGSNAQKAQGSHPNLKLLLTGVSN